MARPLKDGIDYWNIDGSFFSDKKTRLLRSEFGANGIYVLIYILNEIYTNNGYYAKFDKDWCSIVSDGAVCGGSPNFVNELVRGCVRRSFFDKGVFDAFGVITSRGIQKRYIRAVCEREHIRMIKEYFLLDLDDPLEVPEKIGEKIMFKSISDTENLIFHTENPVSRMENTQRKVTESKGKERKGKNVSVSADPRIAFDYQSVVNLFNSVCQSLPKVTKLTDNRKKQIKNAHKQLNGDFESFFRRIEKSDFLTGRNGKWNGCCFDWIFKPQNLIKIIEGNYDNRKEGENNADYKGNIDEENPQYSKYGIYF